LGFLFWYYLKVLATIALAIAGVGLMVIYQRITFKVNSDNIEKSEVYTFLLPLLAFLAGSSIWMIWDPLARKGWMILVFVSFVLGSLFQQSATSPVRLNQFWSKLGKNKRTKK